MPKLWKKDQDTTDLRNLDEVDLSTLKITTPTAIFLSGRETTDKNLKEISKSIHYMNKLVPEGTQVYSWSHGGQLSRLYNMVAYHQFPKKRYRPSAMRFSEGVLKPLVTNDAGAPLPYDEAQKNLRNLTMLGYSAGSLVAQEVFNASMKMMQDSGYTKEDARNLLHEVVLVTIGTVSRPNKERGRFTTVSLANSDDWFVRAKNFVRHPLTRLFMGAGKKRKLRIEASDNSLLITAAARRRGWQLKSREIIEGVELPKWNLMSSNHEAADYINDDYSRSQVAGIVRYSLHNAVNRQETLSPLQLLDPPADLDAKEKTAYQSRIVRALKPV